MRTPACMQGEPLFPYRYELVPPYPLEPEKLAPRLQDAISRRWLSNFGRYVKEFEEKLADLFQVPDVTTVCNATLGLIIALDVLGARGEVIVPSYSFPATGLAALWAGHELVFADIEQEHGTLSAESVQAAVSADTRAIVPMHCFGMAADMENLRTVADRVRVPLICDAAQAVGTRYQNRPLPGLGDLDVVSFHATKVLSIGEGGAIVGKDPKIIEEARYHTNFGFDGKTKGLTKGLGLNAKLAELPAIIGLAQLERLDEMLERRQEWTETYRKNLSGINGLKFVEPRKGCLTNNQLFAVRLDPEKFGMSTRVLEWALLKENVVSRSYFFPPMHRQKSFLDRGFRVQPGGLPLTEEMSTTTICIPIQPDRPVSEAKLIAECILRLRENVSKVNAIFRAQEANS